MTVVAYARDLEVFQRYLDLPTPEAALEFFLGNGSGAAHHIAVEYRAYLIDQLSLAPNTVNRRLASLRSVVKVAAMLGLIEWRLEIPPVQAEAYRDTRGPGRDIVREVMAALGKRGDLMGLRNYALLRCLYDLGLRRAEATSLNVADLDMVKGVLWVKGKGRTEKAPLTLPGPTLGALLRWLEARGNTPGPMFVSLSRNAKGQRLTGRGVASVLDRLGEPLGVHLRPHGIRHTAITDALDATAGDVRAVQRFSRHKSLQVLARYDDNRQDLGGEVAQKLAEALIVQVKGGGN